jgi:hypothetical protein
MADHSEVDDDIRLDDLRDQILLETETFAEFL